MKIKTMALIFVTASLLFTGCTTSPKVKTRWVNKTTSYNDYNNNPQEFRYQPVIGTKQDDTKVMIDMGQYAKIWVKNYKNENQTFVASHSIVTRVREPGFIAGEQIPRSKRDAVSNTYGARSFSFRSSDLNYDNSSQGSDGVTDEQVRDYVNNYEYSKKTEKLEPQRKKDVVKYDEAIKEYIKKTRDEKQALEAKIVAENAAENLRIKQAANEQSDAQYSSQDEYKNGGLK